MPAAAMVQWRPPSGSLNWNLSLNGLVPVEGNGAKYGVTGKSTHDARMAALMVERNIPKLLTFNDGHFARYTEIHRMNPFDVLGVPHA